jgi:hypothetical protein
MVATRFNRFNVQKPYIFAFYDTINGDYLPKIGNRMVCIMETQEVNL